MTTRFSGLESTLASSAKPMALWKASETGLGGISLTSQKMRGGCGSSASTAA